MVSDFAERSRQGKIITRKKPLSIEIKKSIYLLVFTLLSIIVILSIVFLLNTSQTYQKGNILQQEQIKKEQLLFENRELINKIIDAMAYQKVEDSPLIKGMQKPDNLEYIKANPNRTN
jgi:cell division protein FtsL